MTQPSKTADEGRVTIDGQTLVHRQYYDECFWVDSVTINIVIEGGTNIQKHVAPPIGFGPDKYEEVLRDNMFTKDQIDLLIKKHSNDTTN